MAQIFNKTALAESILTSDEAKLLYNMVSPIYGESYVALWIFQAIGKQLDRMKSYAEDVSLQLDPETATWLLPVWEERYRITPGADWDLSQRQKTAANKRKYNAPIFPKKMASMLTALVGVPVDVIENTGKNKFTVYFRQNTTSEKVESARVTIEEAKPAHLIYDIIIAEEYIVPVNNYVAVSAATKEIFNVEVS